MNQPQQAGGGKPLNLLKDYFKPLSSFALGSFGLMALIFVLENNRSSPVYEVCKNALPLEEICIDGGVIKKYGKVIDVLEHPPMLHFGFIQVIVDFLLGSFTVKPTWGPNIITLIIISSSLGVCVAYILLVYLKINNEVQENIKKIEFEIAQKKKQKQELLNAITKYKTAFKDVTTDCPMDQLVNKNILNAVELSSYPGYHHLKRTPIRQEDHADRN